MMNLYYNLMKVLALSFFVFCFFVFCNYYYFFYQISNLINHHLNHHLKPPAKILDVGYYLLDVHL